MNLPPTRPSPTEAEAGSSRPVRLSDLNFWIIWLIYTLSAVLSAGTHYTARLAEREPIPFFYPLIWEFTGHYIAFALMPLLVILFGTFPIVRSNWVWTVPLHLLFSVVTGVIHTVLMFVSRQWIYAGLGLGTYDFGDLDYRFIMEYHKQFLHYWIVYGVLRGIAHYRQSRERERQASALELRASELQRQLAQAQLQELRSQLHPHFLFNTLNMISSVMYENVDRADRMIAALSRMLRMSLDHHVEPLVPMRRELEFVQCAIELIEARFQERVVIEVRCPAEALDIPVPSMILHTLVENAIKHHEAEGDPVIRVQARIERHEAMLELRVLDNGPGIRDLERAMKKGVGLANTRQRLQALYGGCHQFEIINRPEGGLQVRIALPVQPQPLAAPV